MVIYQWVVMETSDYSFSYFESTDRESACRKAYEYYCSNDWECIETDSTPMLSYEEFCASTRLYVQYPDYTEEYELHIINTDNCY